MSWLETQHAFAGALRDPSLPVPDAVGPRDRQAPLARFNVYRNNCAVSLTEAIGDSYPVVRELVGDEFFTAMARAYVAAHAPESPVLLNYGSGFARFIDSFEPAGALPFLGDVARIEWAWIAAYHAADQDSIGADVLQTIEPERLDRTRLKLHPSITLVNSAFPAVSIWSAHQLPDIDQRRERLLEISSRPEIDGEFALILRPEFDVIVELVVRHVWQLLEALGGGATLGEAAGLLDEADTENLGGMLGYIFSTGAVAAVDTETEPRNSGNEGERR